MSDTLKLALGSIAVAIGVLALKAWAAQLTGSVALLSDALESIVNLATAVAALIAVRLAARPADASMPFGYHKAEYISAVIEGVFIVVAALLIFHQAWQGFWAPRAIDAPVEGIAISMVASVINGIWSVVLVRQGRKLMSPALEADGPAQFRPRTPAFRGLVEPAQHLRNAQPPLDFELRVKAGAGSLDRTT